MEFLRDRWQWLLLVALAAVSLALGYVGFMQHFARLATAGSPLDAIYLTLQLFGLNSGAVAHPVPWELQIARFLAPVVAIWTLLKGLALLFREEFTKARLWVIRDHSIVCGLGKTGLELVRECRHEGRRVVAIDVDRDNDHIRVCWQLGAIVLVGDAADELLLQKARVYRAREVIALAGSDGANIQTALHARRLANAQRNALMRPLELYVHMVDLKLCALFKRHRVFTDAADAVDLRAINVYENTARQLLSEHPLDRMYDSSHRPATIHLIIVGFGQMGEALAVQAAKLGHFAHGDQLKMSVIDAQAQVRATRFESQYPEFQKAARISFHQGLIEDQDALATIARLVEEPDTLARVAICLDDDLQSLSAAMTLCEIMPETGISIFVRMADETGLAALLDEFAKEMGEEPRLVPFGMLKRISRRRHLLDEDQDKMARILHAAYINAELAKGRGRDDDAMQPWETLQPGFRDSNRQAADHIPVKLRAIGCYSGPASAEGERFDGFSEEELDLMAQLEHRRWMAEKYLAGWTCGPRDNQKRKHPLLVTWQDLNEADRQKDRASVEQIPALLDTVGARIYRANSSTRSMAADMQ